MKIKRAFATLFAIFLILNLVGCSSSDVSKNSGFSSYVGRELPLQSAVALIKNDSKVLNTFTFDYDEIRTKLIMLDDATPESKWQRIAAVQLPTNHIIFLDKARVEFRGDLQRTVAYGHTILPGSTNQINFAYLWGTDFQIQRAPWEPFSVKPVRWLTGERPPHWDYPIFYGPTNQP